MSKSILSNTATNFSNLPVFKQLVLMVAFATSVALGIGINFWAMTPEYRPLFSNVAPAEMQEVIDVLEKSNIAYEINEMHGSISVARDQVHQARMKLATEGLPNGQGFGLDFLKDEKGLGTSKFMENARYKHAIEGELSRTITSFKNIKAARVHLAIPKTSSFVRKKSAPKASIFIDSYRKSDVTEAQVSAIIHLVSSSVPGMSSENVTVVDEEGQLLTDEAGQNGLQLATKQVKYKHTIESTYVKKIKDLLTPILGQENVQARVEAQIDFTASEKTMESYNPEQAVVRSEHVVQESTSSQRSKGVPGARSQKPGQQRALEDDTQSNAVKESTKSYEVDRTVSHIQHLPGNITKLSVAVVVDIPVDEGSEGAADKLSQELKEIEQLVKNVIGYDAQRGDTLSLIRKSFVKPEAPAALPEIPIYEQDWFWSVVKQSIGVLLILILIMGVLRPSFKQLATAPAVTDQSPQSNQPSKIVMDGDLPNQTNQDGDRVGAVKHLASQHPERIANIMKKWIENN